MVEAPVMEVAVAEVELPEQPAAVGLKGVSACFQSRDHCSEYSRSYCVLLARPVQKSGRGGIQRTKFVMPAGVQMLLANSRVASWSASSQAVETQQEMASMKLVEEQMPLHSCQSFDFFRAV
jgi:hypothetical protein